MTELASPATRALAEPLAAWTEKRIRLDGRPFSFEGHEYLRALYDDPARHVVLQKAAQIGGTVWALVRAIRACMEGLNAGYYFPTKTDVNDFARSRVTPLIEENDFLRRAMSDTDTIGLKRIGAGLLYLRGMQSQVGMKSIPLDVVVFDELDEASPDAKAMAKERLAHSDYKRIIELSNPSLPDYGVDLAYQESDQRHWTLKCPACGRWTCLEKSFPQKLGEDVRVIQARDDGTFFRACISCGAELDLAQGEWVPDHPERPIHGYLISQLHSEKVDPGELLKEYQQTRHPSRFFNLKLGVAWIDAENRLTVPQVLALCGEAGMADASEAPTTMGVDVGKELHVVIGQRRDGSERRRILWLGICRSFAELDDLMRRYGVIKCVIDALPEQRATREFALRHQGKVFLNFFSVHQRGAPRWDDKELIVTENRTEALDATMMAIRRGELVLPRQSRMVEMLAGHLTNLIKQLKEDEETGAQEFHYIRTGPDHFGFALTYEILAAATATLPCGGTPFRDPRMGQRISMITGRRADDGPRRERWAFGIRRRGR